MGITVTDPCFESENDAATESRAEGSVRFEHLLLRPETDPRTDCSADVSAVPRQSAAEHSKAQDSTAHCTAGHDTTPQ